MNNELLTIGLPTAIAVSSFIFAFFTMRNKVGTDAVDVMEKVLKTQQQEIDELKKQMYDMQIKYDGMATLVKGALIEYFGDHSDVAKALLTKV